LNYGLGLPRPGRAGRGGDKDAKGAPFPNQTRRERCRGTRWGWGGRGEAGRDKLCNAKGFQHSSPRPLPASMACSPVQEPPEVRQSPRGAREKEVPHPTAPTRTPSTDPNPESLRAPRRPCKPQPSPPRARLLSLGTALHQDKGPGCALPSNCGGASYTAAGQRGGEK
jgi:hypothetical protein